jgi:hypothetical protein
MLFIELVRIFLPPFYSSLMFGSSFCVRLLVFLCFVIFLTSREAIAVQLLGRAKQGWRAAMFLGHRYPDEEDGGNAYRNLYRKTVARILDEATDLNIYERALWGVQAGQVQAILGMSDDRMMLQEFVIRLFRIPSLFFFVV